MRDVNQGQWRALDPVTSTDGGGETRYGTMELSIRRGSDGRVGGKGHMQDVGHHLHEREGAVGSAEHGLQRDGLQKPLYLIAERVGVVRARIYMRCKGHREGNDKCTKAVPCAGPFTQECVCLHHKLA